MNDELYDDIFDRLYDEAVPNIEELAEEYDGDRPLNYLTYLDGERQLEIIDEVCDEYDVPLGDRRQVKFNVILGKGPSTSVENVDRARFDAGLKPVSEMLEADVEGGSD